MPNGSKEGERGFAKVELWIGVGVLAAIVVAVVAILGMDPRASRADRTGKTYVEEARAAAARDHSKLGWDELAPVAVPMERPQALAVGPAGRIWVAGDRLVALGAGGEVVQRTEPFAEDLEAVAVGPQGRVFAAERERILEFGFGADEPTTRTVIDLAEQDVGIDALVAAGETLFVADAYGSRVLQVPVSGAGLEAGTFEVGTFEVGTFEVWADGFYVPSAMMDIAADPEDTLVTVDPGRHAVQTRDGYGDVLRSFGKEGPDLGDFHGCCNPAAIARFPDGRTVTAEKGLIATRVKVYGRDGRLENLVANLDAFDERPDGPVIVLDVAVDAQGRVLVLDPARRQVRTFVPKAPQASTEEKK